ncbi:MAG: lipoprotein insertase outer membrane protein LolB [Gallionella sp.]|nr:lipoprotein insertase outer membrane protein LolB [Gallionella sp.]
MQRSSWDEMWIFRDSLMRWWAILLAGVLSGCALLSPAPAPVARPAQPETAAFALNGRISINHRGERHSAGLRWTHQAQSDEILLLAPLGQTAARIYRDTRQATLDDGDKHYQASDVETLMEQVLHWHLPLGGLHHWVLGMADVNSPAKVEHAANGQISMLQQDGWEVRYLRYDGNMPGNLPKRMQLSHEDLQVQLLIDEWEWNPQ